jgi:ubiquinone/menaquinone biosynthesis C-methylase UbiE
MMSEQFEKRVDYDKVAPTYDKRFAYYAGAPRGVAAALIDLAGEVHARQILEVGCGTGHWLRLLSPLGYTVFGLDRSAGMLAAAQAVEAPNLARGEAGALPFPPASFDLVICVNALHHFADASQFISEGRRLLRPGGALAIVGMHPHSGRDRWYLYDYFPGTKETDLQRYPSAGEIVNWMIEAGFDLVRWQTVERLHERRKGREILDEPMLHKNATSQLTLLSDVQYAAGITRIQAAIAQAEASGEAAVFEVDISLHMLVGYIQLDLPP